MTYYSCWVNKYIFSVFTIAILLRLLLTFTGTWLVARVTWLVVCVTWHFTWLVALVTLPLYILDLFFFHLADITSGLSKSYNIIEILFLNVRNITWYFGIWFINNLMNKIFTYIFKRAKGFLLYKTWDVLMAAHRSVQYLLLRFTTSFPFGVVDCLAVSIHPSAWVSGYLKIQADGIKENSIENWETY